MIMKTKISHRFLSLFAAVLVAFSLISTVALAAEIQPRISTCPNCNSERTSYGYTWAPEPFPAFWPYAFFVCPKTPLYSFQEPLPDNFSKKIPCKISGTKSCSMAFCSRKHGARLIPHGNKNRFLILHGTVTFHTAKPYSVISNPFISDSSGM